MAGLGSDWVFSFNGFLFGGPGQGVQILDITGLEDLPSLRVQDDNRGYADGMFTGRDFLNGRIISMTCSIMSDANASMQTYVQQMKAAFVSQSSGTSAFRFKLPTRNTQQVQARVRKRDITIDPNYVYGRAIAHIEFFCPDPRIYDDTASTGTLSPVTSVGRTYLRTYPLTYNSSSGLTNSAPFINTGNYTTFPTYTISGVCSNPTIQNITTGQILSFNISLGAADTLVVNSDLRTVILNGNTNVRNTLVGGSTWFGLPAQPVPAVTPQQATTLLFTTLSYSISQPPTCTVFYRNANI
jgi:hypothetical protein